MPSTLGIVSAARLTPGYLSTAIGQLSTPDTADMTITGPVRLVCKVNPDYSVGVEGSAYFAAQWGSSPTTNGAWFWAPRNTGLMWGRYDAAGVRVDYAGMNLAELQTHLIRGQNCYIGLDIKPNAGTVTGIRSSDGVTWTPVRTATSAAFTVRDSPVSLAVGALIVPAPVNPPARLYWAQMEALDAAGNPIGVVWCFDASEVPKTTPVFTDILDTDSNVDGVADGWIAYVFGSPTGISRSIVDGHQRVQATFTAATQYVGVTTETSIPVVAGQAAALTTRISGTIPSPASANVMVSYRDSGGAAVGTALQSNVTAPATPGQIVVSFTPPTGAVTALVTMRIYGGATPPATPCTLDIYDVRVDQANQSYTDPRSRQWTITNPAAITLNP